MYIPTKADNADKAERGKCYAIGSPVELKYRAVAVDKTVKPATKKVKAQTLAVQPVAQPAPVIASGIMSEPSRRPLKMYRRQGRLFIAGDDTMLNQIATVIARHSS